MEALLTTVAQRDPERYDGPSLRPFSIISQLTCSNFVFTGVGTVSEQQLILYRRAIPLNREKGPQSAFCRADAWAQPGFQTTLRGDELGAPRIPKEIPLESSLPRQPIMFLLMTVDPPISRVPLYGSRVATVGLRSEFRTAPRDFGVQCQEG